MTLRALIALGTLVSGCTGQTPTSDTEETGDTDEPLPPFECTYVDAPPFGTEGSVPIHVKVVADGLATPWGIGWLPSGEMLVTERDGVINRISGGVVTPLGTVPSLENSEGGLLGIAIDPEFATNRAFYIYYTASKGGTLVNRVARWTLSADGNSIAEDTIIVDDMSARQFHNGGRLRMGPDNKLYIGTGDAGEPDVSQDSTIPPEKSYG